MSDRFSYKAVLNKNYDGEKLGENEIKRLQETLMIITQEIVDVCDKHDIKLFLQGGSLLGYVRHGGFIPWDDDVDYGMLREDYEKFIRVFNNELSDKYIMSAPKKGYQSFNRFIQLFRKGTVLDDGRQSKCERPKNIYIDIFPLDYVPENNLLRTCKGIVANGLMAIGGSVSDAYFLEDETKEIIKSSKEGRLLMAARGLLGKAFSWRKPERWFEVIDGFVFSTKETKLLTSAMGRRHYLGETIPKEAILPLQKVTFEGVNLYAPNRPEEYLANLYGDYMTIPPEEDRESHYAIRLQTF